MSATPSSTPWRPALARGHEVTVVVGEGESHPRRRTDASGRSRAQKARTSRITAKSISVSALPPGRLGAFKDRNTPSSITGITSPARRLSEHLAMILACHPKIATCFISVKSQPPWSVNSYSCIPGKYPADLVDSVAGKRSVTGSAELRH